MENIAAIILAGGRGTRMKSDLPKVLQKIGGQPIVLWTLELLKSLGVKNVIVVTGYKAIDVKNEINSQDYSVKFVHQDEPMGTAHAVATGLKRISKDTKNLLVLFGDDSGLYKPRTIQDFLSHHDAGKSPMTILTVSKPGYEYLGGIARDESGNVVGVANESSETVCGAFCFNREWLLENLKKIQKSPTNGEYGLPSLIKIAAEQKRFAETFKLTDTREWTSVNTQEELKYANTLKEELAQNRTF